MFCTTCGTKLQADAEVCGNCGTAFSQPPHGTTSQRLEQPIEQATTAPPENMTGEKTAQWYKAEIEQLEALQNERVWHFAIGGVVLGIAVLLLFNFIGNLLRVDIIDLGAIGILLIIGGIGLVPYKLYLKKKRAEIINELKRELARLPENNR